MSHALPRVWCQVVLFLKCLKMLTRKSRRVRMFQGGDTDNNLDVLLGMGESEGGRHLLSHENSQEMDLDNLPLSELIDSSATGYDASFRMPTGSLQKRYI